MFRTTAAAIIVALSTPVSALPAFSDIYVFGDSLSDTGNVAALLGNNRYIRNEVGYGTNGRFSNGAVWHEYLADSFGMARASAVRKNGGNDYSHGGARTDFAIGPRQGILLQGAEYGITSGLRSDPDALYIAWTGGNDVQSLADEADAELVLDARLDNFETMLKAFAASGATSLLVPNLPDIGQIPKFSDRDTKDRASALTVQWNDGLAELSFDIASTYGIDVFQLDVFSIFNDILADPLSNGFINTTDECRSLTALGLIELECRDADRFVFWDDVHPTTAAHRLIAERAFDLIAGSSLFASAFAKASMIGRLDTEDVPSPAVPALLGLGVIALAAYRRRRSAIA
ncbi:MAG: SGNH/GDSL hydrolase family protein [Pseudomonadota bacterium]